VPHGLVSDIIEIFCDKFAAGVFEHLDTSYRSGWFCVRKKSGKLHLVHDLQPLNMVTICNSGIPPLADQVIEAMAGKSCYSLLDLYVGYNHCSLDVSSCDLMTIQSPIGTLWLTWLPQGWTNVVAIFHKDIAFLIEPEMPHVAWSFIDNCCIKGPTTHYEALEDTYEMIPGNHSIRHFIWEHLNDIHCILH